jgi:hypothetical protein
MMDLLQAVEPKLYMVLLGSKARARNVEQHDYFFGIATSIRELTGAMKNFWPEAGSSLHVDGWREITRVGDHAIRVVPRSADAAGNEQLYFINLGGYTTGTLTEQHHILLTVKPDKSSAIQEAKRSLFFKQSTAKGMKGANAHIDEKYGVDIDEVFNIEDILADEFKSAYRLQITPATGQPEDQIILGYFKLDKL